MDMHPVNISLPDPLLRAAQDLAQARDISLGALIRAALNAVQIAEVLGRLVLKKG